MPLWPRSIAAVASDVIFLASVAADSVAHLLKDASDALRDKVANG